MTDIPIHSYEIDEAKDQFATHLSQGLTSAEARRRLLEGGPNELVERPQPGFWKLLVSQFANFLVIILIVAAILSLLLGEYIDAAVILAIVFLNAVLGVLQEYKAEQALTTLQKMAAPTANVVRDGHKSALPARELVPGDIVFLEGGNYIPADLRLVETVNLKVEEAALTGESVPVEKDARLVLDREIPLGDRKNSAFMGTLVTYGRGTGLVVSTGMHTQIGMIAEMLQSYDQEPTPLQLKLNQLGKSLGVISLAVCGFIFFFGIVRDTDLSLLITSGLDAYISASAESIVNLFMTAVSLAIAAVPEGLPAVVTICLAIGMQRMVRRHALIRRLPAVETLGCATVICSDKTGTLTQNEMTVVQGWASGESFLVGGNSSGNEIAFTDLNGRPINPRQNTDFDLLLTGALLCNDARLETSGVSQGEKTWRVVGDPTEGALLVAAMKAGIDPAQLHQIYPRILELPFDSERKRMLTVHQIVDQSIGNQPEIGDEGHYIAFIKGAPDIILDYCTTFYERGNLVQLTLKEKECIESENHALAKQALRVLGVAWCQLAVKPSSKDLETLENNLSFIGLLGMIDPPRPEVIEAVSVARGAGLKTVMVTGDYSDTARAIAEGIGLLSPDGRVLTGAELDRMSEEDLGAVVDHIDAYARVSPQHKLKIVEALKSRGHVVAMTGDGVNDAPALKRANIGIAMGISGTDVTKETADMVLTDDNYASIVASIEEGRVIFSNIRKFVYYLISCNIGEILVIFVSMLAGLPLPLTAIQLLWLNLVTDGAPALALGLEKGEPEIMMLPPRPPKEPVINHYMLAGIIVQAVAMTSAVLAAFIIALQRYPGNLALAQTIAFTTLVISELVRALTARSEFDSIFTISLSSNRWMLYALGASLALMIFVIYVPVLQNLFGTTSLVWQDWFIILPLAMVASIAAEITKWIFRKINQRLSLQRALMPTHH